MQPDSIDRAVIGAAFDIAAEQGWSRLSVAEAARRAGVELAQARARFPNRVAILVRFGRLADQTALTGVMEGGSTRDRLFDMLMRRIDVLQAHRAGMLALLRHLPFDPLTALLLAGASVNSMGWMLDAAGLPAGGAFGRLRAKGLFAVWLATLRAWQGDDSADLSATMSALDRALQRAAKLESFLPQTRRDADDLPSAAPVVDVPEDQQDRQSPD